MYVDKTDLYEKAEFFNAVMAAIVDAGYPDPGYYVDECDGQPFIFDPNNNPVCSIAGDSPIAILSDFVKVYQ